MKRFTWRPVVLALMLISVWVMAPASTVLADTVTYTYDELGRVKQVTYDNGMQIVYTYDAAGNRTAVVVSGLASNGTFRGRVTFNGIRPIPPDPTWQVPLVVTFLQPGASTVLMTATPTTDASGNFAVSNVPPRIYDIQVKYPLALSKLARNVTVAVGDNPPLNFGQLAVGDVNNDDEVSLLDFSILRTTFGKCLGDAGHDARADLNGDWCVDLVDFSLLRLNFGQVGPQSVP